MSRRLLKAGGYLLGVPAGRPEEFPVCVWQVCPQKGSWRFDLAGTAISPIEIAIHPLADDGRYYLKNDGLGFSYNCDVFDTTHRQLLDRICLRLSNTSFQEIDGLLLGLSHTSTDKAFSAPAGSFEGVHQSWNHPDTWKNYFADHEYSQDQSQALDFDFSVITLSHTPYDCTFLCSREFIRSPWKVTYPSKGKGAPPGSQDSMPGGVCRSNSTRRYYLSNLKDIDVINGGEELFGGLIEQATRDSACDLMLVDSGCIPQLIGDDIESILEACRKKVSYPIINIGNKSAEDYFTFYSRALRKGILESECLERAEGSYNLIGLLHDRSLDEVVRYLRTLGLELNVSMVPWVSPGAARQYLRARLQVLCGSRIWSGLVDGIFRDLPITTIKPPAPFGLANTRTFYREIASVLGGSQMVARVEADHEKFVEEEWSPAVAGNQDFSVGLACSSSQLPRLYDPSRLNGVPLIPALKEMGFSPVLAVITDGVPTKTTEERLAGVEFEGLKWDIISSEQELSDWIRTRRVVLMYSDYSYDERLIRSGCLPFSMHCFEKGWTGALRTLLRLGERCRVGFYRRYAKYLQGGTCQQGI